ncbi:common central domain of tyrosinase [Ancylostoma duodenale]|uniref:Common central domain of tyrosinase n=1 Tax=Ancylostoma duodenale TaxID=51022 RepID=A0A0C2HHH6_9BILA|nr:common central domain of tyrosinase [Ancylostoma duodenale]
MGTALLLFCSGILSVAVALKGSLEDKWLEFCGSFPYHYETACHQFARWDYEARRLWDSIPKEKPNKTVYDCMDLKCLCGYMRGDWVGSRCLLFNNGTVLGKALRREYRMLTEEERRRYHEAMNKIKENGEYDKLAKIHKDYFTSPAAHGGSGFLPWNREYMKRLEIALRMVDHEVALPYWDSTLDYELSDPRYSVLWSEELMGEQDYDGFGSGIKRNVGDKGYLMKETDITTITDWTNEYEHIFAHTAASLDCPNPGYWSAIEYIGADPQLFVGGDMENFLTASNDPLFWSLHAMIDLIWQRWRNLYQPMVSDRENQYPANDTTCSGPAHFRDSPMVPFNNFKIIDGLSNDYTREYARLLRDFVSLIMSP